MKMSTEKRAHERIPLDMEVTIFKFNTTYSGTLKNISQNGMYIKADKPFPLTCKAKLRVFIPFNNTIFEVPVRVKRLVKEERTFIGMGVVILNWSRAYMDFMNNLHPTN